MKGHVCIDEQDVKNIHARSKQGDEDAGRTLDRIEATGCPVCRGTLMNVIGLLPGAPDD